MTNPNQTNARALARCESLAAGGVSDKNRPAADAFSKAAYELAGGLDIRMTGRMYMVPSRTNSNVYAVDVQNRVCSCLRGTSPNTWCWHKAAALAIDAELAIDAHASDDPYEDLDAPFDEADYPETVVEVIDADVCPEFVDSDPAFWEHIAAMIEAGDVIATEVQ